MARVKVRTLEIQFDLDDDNAHTVEQALRRHIKDNLDLINLTLQREPYGLCAQITNGDLAVDCGEFFVEEDEEDDDEIEDNEEP
jgi:hypothetical protein